MAVKISKDKWSQRQGRVSRPLLILGHFQLHQRRHKQGQLQKTRWILCKFIISDKKKRLLNLRMFFFGSNISENLPKHYPELYSIVAYNLRKTQMSTFDGKFRRIWYKVACSMGPEFPWSPNRNNFISAIRADTELPPRNAALSF